MIARRVLAAAVIACVCGALGCNQILGLEPAQPNRANMHFAGCFTGTITGMAGTAQLTVVLEAPSSADTNLVGCMHADNPLFDASHAGAVLHDDHTQALLAVMPAQWNGFFTVRAVRTPTGVFDDAQTITLINESGPFPFDRSTDMTRCTLTCADLARPQSFAPMVAP